MPRSNPAKASRQILSANGNNCIRITPVTLRAGSIQKDVVAQIRIELLAADGFDGLADEVDNGAVFPARAAILFLRPWRQARGKSRARRSRFRD